MNNQVEEILYKTTDPNYEFIGKDVPAISSLLYNVCDGNMFKFDEATRLIRLFITQALESK